MTLNSFRYIFIALLLCTSVCWAGEDYKLYVNGVLYKAPSILEKGLPYFPVDVLAEATRVRVVSFSDSSVRLHGSPVDFVPVVRNGRPFLPAEAFALATGSSVERDQARGLVLYTGSAAPIGNVASPAGSTPGDGTDLYVPAQANGSGPARANPGVSPDDPGPEAPVSAPAAAIQGSPNSEGLQEAVIGAMKTAQEVTYAQRWLKHKMYWADQLDPANSPYLRVNLPPAATFPMYTPHPWATP